MPPARSFKYSLTREHTERSRRADGEQVDCPYSQYIYTRKHLRVCTHTHPRIYIKEVVAQSRFSSWYHLYLPRPRPGGTSRTSAFPSLFLSLPSYPRGSSTWYLFHVGFPPILYSDTAYALNGRRISSRRLYALLRAGQAHPFIRAIDARQTTARSNLTPETECVWRAVAVLTYMYLPLYRY